MGFRNYYKSLAFRTQHYPPKNQNASNNKFVFHFHVICLFPLS